MHNNKMRSVLATVLISAVAALVVGSTAPISRGAIAAALQGCSSSCDCVLTQSSSSSDPGPSCYSHTNITVTGTANGCCIKSGCTVYDACDYNITISVYAGGGGLGPVCDMEIKDTCGGAGTLATCTACTSLSWTHPGDPATIVCDAAADTRVCYEVWVCNTPQINCLKVAWVTFNCTQC